MLQIQDAVNGQASNLIASIEDALLNGAYSVSKTIKLEYVAIKVMRAFQGIWSVSSAPAENPDLGTTIIVSFPTPMPELEPLPPAPEQE